MVATDSYCHINGDIVVVVTLFFVLCLSARLTRLEHINLSNQECSSIPPLGHFGLESYYHCRGHAFERKVLIKSHAGPGSMN